MTSSNVAGSPLPEELSPDVASSDELEALVSVLSAVVLDELELLDEPEEELFDGLEDALLDELPDELEFDETFVLELLDVGLPVEVKLTVEVLEGLELDSDESSVVSGVSPGVEHPVVPTTAPAQIVALILIRAVPSARVITELKRLMSSNLALGWANRKRCQ